MRKEIQKYIFNIVNELINDPKIVSETFNRYFIDTPDNIRKKLPPQERVSRIILKTVFQILFISHLSAMLKLKEK